MNLAWSPTFMWDGGIFDLDFQPIAPITNHVEMDESIDNILVKLRSHPDYPALFKKAFGSDEISTARTMKALSQFMVMCVSADARYDSVVRGLSAFSPIEEAGYAIFKQKCASCHKEPLFTDHSFRNNGLAIGLNGDEGRAEVTLNPSDRFRFKVPSLRNVEFTAPYMHDGRFVTLDAVLNHYAGGVQQTPNVDSLVRNGIALTPEEKTNLLAFLRTLSDRKFLANQSLSEQ
ncbi:hypothetical protein GCM10023184_38950 [Flaviaesturariibacter amylovorans]|uniref:Cytochrome c domain-containing protein n=2 Tax=Flaviaesturariibacter amylovorans TaxID=1084520 RepID=A0ABP8HLD5_9BACT